MRSLAPEKKEPGKSEEEVPRENGCKGKKSSLQEKFGVESRD